VSRIRRSRFPALLIVFSILAFGSLTPRPSSAAKDPENGHTRVRVKLARPGEVRDAHPAVLAGQTVVNFQELSHHGNGGGGQARVLIQEEAGEDPDEPLSELSPSPPEAPSQTFVTSPSPTSSFMGLDDIPMVDSLYIVIPPDVGGAVGPTRVMDGHNNNYRVLNKADGSVISTVGTATFWAPSGETALNGLTDPREMYDPYNNRWIAVMQTVTTGAGDILVGVSQTSDPAGNWNLYRFAMGATIDFPTVGFNKNWIVIGINAYGHGPNPSFAHGLTLAVNYPQARAGTGSGTLFTQGNGSHFCSAPCLTYSSTTDTMYVVTHLSSPGATYEFDRITGTAAAPVYTVLQSSLTRPGGGWQQPGGNTLPQSPPNTGTSACGSSQCPIESQDSQIRSAPTWRNGFIYYTQTIGLPATGWTRTSVQWTKLASDGSFVDGGLIDDPTANSTNGGKWYAYPHIAVNAAGDFLIGYSQFSSAQHPSSGYSMHLAGDAAGTLRDPLIYKVGEDYYHKTFTTTTGRNRWGDFSQAQVDPSDDQTLWTLQEYAKARTGIDDGNGVNSSRWSTWWASVAATLPPPIVTLASGPSQNEGNGGFTPFQFTVNLSTPAASPVIVRYHTSDGTATVADNDYVAKTDSITIGTGLSSGTITIQVVGDTKVEGNETFGLTLTGATNGVLGSPIATTATILNDDAYTIAASAGANGSITPSGAVSVAAGADQSFTIAANPCSHIGDVLVDGGSVGAVTTYTFTAVAANHTIAASFVTDLTVSVGDFIAPEGNSGTTDFNFPVTLSGPCSATVSVSWKTADGTATVADNDYAPDSSQVTFPPTQTSGTITVHVNGDTHPENTETFLVNLLNPVGIGIADGQGVGTILNDDSVTGVETSTQMPREVSFAVQGPVSGSALFRIGLPASSTADLSVFDVAGRRVAHLVSGELSAGFHTIPWAAGLASSGVYFARFRAQGRSFTSRFVVVR
jgi:hypothetical protein